jgi:hypothetical protein
MACNRDIFTYLLFLLWYPYVEYTASDGRIVVNRKDLNGGSHGVWLKGLGNARIAGGYAKIQPRLPEYGIVLYRYTAISQLPSIRPSPAAP